MSLTRILIIDDEFGRILPGGHNEQRARLCTKFLLEDVTGDGAGQDPEFKVREPIAQAVFFRGQQPVCSPVGTTVENDLAGALEVVRRGWVEWRPDRPRWAMVLVDLCFYTGPVTPESDRDKPGMPEGRDEDGDPRKYFGLRMLRAIKDEFPGLPVAILSSKPSRETSQEWTRLGAADFLERDDPDGKERLRALLEDHGLLPDRFGLAVGHSVGLLLALRDARRAASTRQHVLIRGERGTGKELLAEYLHRLTAEKEKGGRREDRPLVTVNSSVLRGELPTELFGHEKHAFTDALQRHIGLIEKAKGGDLFLDEIGDMLPQVQAGLKRVLQDGTFNRVGGTEMITGDVRCLSATNHPIEAWAATGAFQPDLLDRLRAGGTLYLPPLRQRVEDIPVLVEAFVREVEQEIPGAVERTIEPDTLELLAKHDWPGNVRELRNCIRAAVVGGKRTRPHLVPNDIQLVPSASVAGGQAAPAAPARTPDPRPPSPEPTPAAGTNVPSRSTAVPQDVDALLTVMEGFSFGGLAGEALRGRLPQIRDVVARLLARYITATLHETKEVTVESPNGAPQIQPAVRLGQADSKLSGRTPQDILKRLVKIAPPEALEAELRDPLFRAVFDKLAGPRVEGGVGYGRSGGVAAGREPDG